MLLTSLFRHNGVYLKMIFCKSVVSTQGSSGTPSLRAISSICCKVYSNIKRAFWTFSELGTTNSSQTLIQALLVNTVKVWKMSSQQEMPWMPWTPTRKIWEIMQLVKEKLSYNCPSCLTPCRSIWQIKMTPFRWINVLISYVTQNQLDSTTWATFVFFFSRNCARTLNRSPNNTPTANLV